MDITKIPSYAELITMNEDQYNELMSKKSETQKSESEYIDLFLKLVNKPFPEQWLKDVTVGGGRKIKYAPIWRLEFLATRLFGVFKRREILHEGLMLNSVYARVRFHYKIPGTNIWLYEDGAGAAPIQVDANEIPGDQNSRKVRAGELAYLKSTAVQQAYPSAVSYAMSNAMERIGELFGKNLNKPEAEKYQGYVNPDDLLAKPNEDVSEPNSVVATEIASTTTQNPVQEPAITVIQPPAQKEQVKEQVKQSPQIQILF